MQWLDDVLPTLEQHLCAMTDAARQMLAVLTREHDLLHAREIPSPDLLREKARWALELEQQQTRFQAFRTALPTENLAIPLMALPDSPKTSTIKLRWRETELLFQDCDRQNAVNGQMLHRLHVRNQLFGRILSNQSTDPTYSRQGQLAEGRQGTLGHA